MRKLALPLIASCAMFGITAAPSLGASTNAKQWKKIAKVNGAVKGIAKAVKLLEDADTTQNAGAVSLATKISSIQTTLDAVVATAGSALPKIEDALKQLKAGLESAGAGIVALSQATATPVGTATPTTADATTTATSSVPAVTLKSLAAGTVYRQFVQWKNASGATPTMLGPGGAGLLTADQVTALGELPIAVRTWVKMPDVTADAPLGVVYDNSWVCTAAGVATDGETKLNGVAMALSSGTVGLDISANDDTCAVTVATVP
jgi:hypothetical protein